MGGHRGHDHRQDNRFRFALRPHGQDTSLQFLQQYAQELDTDTPGTYRFNWDYYLNSLKRYCETESESRTMSRLSRTGRATPLRLAGSHSRTLCMHALLLGAALSLGAPDLGAQRCGQGVRDSLAVAEVAHGIIAADNNRDIDLVLSYYRPDAVLMPPGESPVHGRPSIRPRYEALFEQYDPAIVGQIDEVEICGGMAVVSGRNGGWLRGREGRPDRRLSDVYLMVLRFEDAHWRIARLIWHPDRQN